VNAAASRRDSRYARRVLLTARHLVDRLGAQRARADALRELRQRLDAFPGPSRVSPELAALGRELGDLRERLTAALAEVRCCSGCAQGHPLPFGRWPGGHCCGGDTQNVFGDDELAALKLSGTTPGRLVPPRSELAGCAFRGSAGCSLSPRDRPTLCVRFLCRQLESELRERGDLRPIRALQTELTAAFARFTELRGAPLPELPAEWHTLLTRGT